LAGLLSRYFQATQPQIGRRWRRNGEFCLAVDPVARSAGICCLMYDSLVWSNPRRLKALKDELPRNGPYSICVIFFCLTNETATIGNIMCNILLSHFTRRKSSSRPRGQLSSLTDRIRCEILCSVLSTVDHTLFRKRVKQLRNRVACLKLKR